MRNNALPAAATALFLLAGCGQSANSPSLAPRAVEREYSNAPPPTGPCAADTDGCFNPVEAEPAPIADDMALRARIAELSASAAKGQAAFDAILPAANSAASAAGEAGSDSWIGAQEQLSRLEAARGATVEALSALDALEISRASLPTSDNDRAALTAAVEEARRRADGQQAEIEKVRSALSQP